MNFIPKFITRSKKAQRESYGKSIYAVIDVKDVNNDRRKFWVFDIIDGRHHYIYEENVVVCHYDAEVVWGVGNDFAYYNPVSLRAQRKDGPAASIDGKKVFCWKGCITYNKEKFFEYLTKEEKLEAAFNLDEF